METPHVILLLCDNEGQTLSLPSLFFIPCAFTISPILSLSSQEPKTILNYDPNASTTDNDVHQTCLSWVCSLFILSIYIWRTTTSARLFLSHLFLDTLILPLSSQELETILNCEPNMSLTEDNELHYLFYSILVLAGTWNHTTIPPYSCDKSNNHFLSSHFLSLRIK